MKLEWRKYSDRLSHDRIAEVPGRRWLIRRTAGKGKAYNLRLNGTLIKVCSSRAEAMAEADKREKEIGHEPAVPGA